MDRAITIAANIKKSAGGKLKDFRAFLDAKGELPVRWPALHPAACCASARAVHGVRGREAARRLRPPFQGHAPYFFVLTWLTDGSGMG